MILEKVRYANSPTRKIQFRVKLENKKDTDFVLRLSQRHRDDRLNEIITEFNPTAKHIEKRPTQPRPNLVLGKYWLKNVSIMSEWKAIYNNPDAFFTCESYKVLLDAFIDGDVSVTDAELLNCINTYDKKINRDKEEEIRLKLNSNLPTPMRLRLQRVLKLLER